jgi:hypothetical protein
VHDPPSFACRPTGCKGIDVPSVPWKPSAVTAAWFTGSWMWSAPCVATISASGGPFGFPRLPFGSESWNGGTDELKAATMRTMKIASATTPSTARRPLRLDTFRLCLRASTGRRVAREEAIASP